jgi:hypothetical protein
VIVSFLLLAAEIVTGGLARPRLVMLGAWFLVAAYLQFRGGTSVLSVAGLVGQVALAIYLRIRVTLRRGGLP